MRHVEHQALRPVSGRVRVSVASFVAAALLLFWCRGAAADPHPGSYDLAAHPWQAQLRAGGIVVDLGQRARHKHTLDESSGWRGDTVTDGISHSSVIGPRAVIRLDAFAEEAGGGTIVISARAGTSDTAAVLLNGIEIGWFEVPRERFVVVELPFDEGIAPGANEVVIEPDEPVISADAGSPALEVDYLRLVPSGTPAPGAPPPTAPATSAAGVTICRGCSLAYNAILTAGARLEIEAQADGRGALETTVRTGPGEVARHALSAVDTRPRKTTIALDDLAERAVSITLAAVDAAVTLRTTELSAGDVGIHDAAADLPARNLLLVLVDTLRADRLRVYNPTSRVRTPNLNRLAQSSLLFERALAPESWTKPSVASLLTGLYPQRHAVRSHQAALPAQIPFGPEVLRAQGFHTAAFVGNGYISERYGFARGWDRWQVFDGALGRNTARHIVDATLRWLQRRPRDQRFFAYVHTIDPHAPYTAPGEFRHLYVQRRYLGGLRPAATAQALREHSAGQRWIRPRDRQWLEDLYDGEVTYNDFHLGRLLDGLVQAGLDRDTLVVVTADHGEEFMEHGQLGHGFTVYEELLHVPLLVRLPGGNATGRTGREVGLTDVLPTACAVLRVDCPPDVDGRPLLGLAPERTSGRIAPSFSGAAGAGLHATRAGQLKLVCRGLDCALYDLALDPGETTDVGPEQPIALGALRDALGEHLGGAAARRLPVVPLDPAVDATELDEATRRQLVALGYLDD